MEIGAVGSRLFERIMRLAGVPEGPRDLVVVQSGREAQARTEGAGKVVTVAWRR